MVKLTKRAKYIAKKIELGNLYEVSVAIDLLNALSTVRFKESLDVSVNLGVDTRKSDQVVRGSTMLPKGNGKNVRVVVFAQGNNVEKAMDAGADEVGLENLVEKIKLNKLDFDVAIATPEVMPIVGRLGQILGPRGLMPNVKLGTIALDVSLAVKNAKSGQVRYKTDKNGIIHCSIGQIGFLCADIESNLIALLGDLKKMKPSSAKGVYFKKVTLSSTMGPGLSIDFNALNF